MTPAPSQTPSTYLLNAWTDAGWSDELAPGQLLARTLAERPVVLFRDAKGQAHALQDRCPHRFAPLSMGQLTDAGGVRCPYHGLVFAPDGACIENPHGDARIPSAARVDAYPLLERWGTLWIWLGDATRADPAALPNFAPLSRTDSHVACGYLAVSANYVLECDNILDLSHIQFLHPGTLGSSAVQDARTEVNQDGHTITCSRQVRNESVSPFLCKMFDIPPDTRVDRWLDVRWDPPGSLLQTVTIAPTGRPREQGRTAHIAHLFSPEGPRRTHYWYASCFARSAYPDGAERAQAHVKGLSVPFDTEDRPVLEAQQARLGEAEFWSLKPVLLPTDAAAVRARRVLDQLIKQSA